MNLKTNTPYKKNTSSKKKYLAGSAFALFIVIAIIAGLELSNTTHLFHKKSSQPISASAYTKGEPSTSSSKSSMTTNSTSSTSNSTSSEPGDQKSSSGGGSSADTTLLVPSGDFVSNHSPNLSNSPAPNEISSVCTTTPGATCTITFTKDGVTKSLPQQTTDRGGSTYWDWKLQTVGLTVGTWQINAVATLNGQTKSAADAINLNVAE